MPFRWDVREHYALARYALRWCAIAIPVAGVIGSACALFLWLLDVATRTFWGRPWLLYLLPAAGIVIALAYRSFGRSAERGNNLIMDEIHEPGAGIPAVMAPLILVATVITHLFGGSAGREGTAVQIGGSVASTFGRWLKLPRADVRRLLMVGIAAGFAGVFGTPLAAAVFAMEVVAIGRMNYEAMFPCLVAGVVGDWACTAWGIHHTQYHVEVGPVAFQWTTAGKVALAAVAFGLASVAFAELTHGLQHVWRKLIKYDFLRPVAGGAVVIGLVYLTGTRDYLGLGVVSPRPGGVSIVSSFRPGGAEWLSWWWKILFTAVTLSSGFKGGEVTPLFFIGATLGNALARLLDVPLAMGAGVGLAAVFAAAANTPLALSVMAVELLGAAALPHVAIVSVLAYLLTGQRGIYPAQRIGRLKHGGPLLQRLVALRDLERREPPAPPSAPG